MDLPGLAMSRSLSDDVVHRAGVISEPDIRIHEIDIEHDLFIVWASDGVFEFLDNLYVAKVRKMLEGNFFVFVVSGNPVQPARPVCRRSQNRK